VVERERDYEVGVKVIQLERKDLHRLNRYLSKLPDTKRIRRGPKGGGLKVSRAKENPPA
jgi:hypothetical protein